MEKFVFAIEGNGPRREWWVGDGRWWLLVEGFGLVTIEGPFSGFSDDT